MNFNTLLAFGISLMIWGVALGIGYAASLFIGLPAAIGIGLGCIVAMLSWFWYETKIAKGE